MTSQQNGERISALETDMRNLIKRIDAMNLKLDAANKTLDEMSGGKKAVLGMFALIGSAIGVFATLFGVHFFGK